VLVVVVISTPKVYTKAVAVKTLVVDFPLLQWFSRGGLGGQPSFPSLPCIPKLSKSLFAACLPVSYSSLSKRSLQSASMAFESLSRQGRRAHASYFVYLEQTRVFQAGVSPLNLNSMGQTSIQQNGSFIRQLNWAASEAWIE